MHIKNNNYKLILKMKKYTHTLKNQYLHIQFNKYKHKFKNIKLINKIKEKYIN